MYSKSIKGSKTIIRTQFQCQTTFHFFLRTGNNKFNVITSSEIIQYTVEIFHIVHRMPFNRKNDIICPQPCMNTAERVSRNHIHTALRVHSCSRTLTQGVEVLYLHSLPRFNLAFLHSRRTVRQAITTFGRICESHSINNRMHISTVRKGILKR